MQYCLDTEELRQILEWKVSGTHVEDANVARLIEEAADWECELGALTYLFCRILESRSEDSGDCRLLIQALISLSEEMRVFIQYCDVDFVKYMLAHSRSSSLTLGGELIELHTNWREFNYDRAVRY